MACAFDFGLDDYAVVLPNRFLEVGKYRTNDTWQAKALRYAIGTPAEVVIVGSSLAARLPDQFYTKEHIFNLSLPGGSSLTGAEIVACHRPLPQILLIEANIFDRDTDNNLIQHFCVSPLLSERAILLFREIHPLRLFLSYFFNDKNSRTQETQNGFVEMEKLRRSPPKDYDIETSIRDAVKAYETRDYEAATNSNAKLIHQLVKDLSAQGVKVFFFDMPMPLAVWKSRYHVGTDEILRKELGNEGQWLQLDFDYTALRWVDHGHLDPRSAVLVADAITAALERFRSLSKAN